MKISVVIPALNEEKLLPKTLTSLAALDRKPDEIIVVNASSTDLTVQVAEKMGAKVISQWVTLGPYDFVNVVEAPDNVTMAKISAELSSRGTIRVMTMAAIPMDEFIANVRK